MNENLIKKLSDHFGEEFELNLSEATNSGFYYLKRASNPKSTRFWIRFSHGTDADYFSAGDFQAGPEKNLRGVVDFNISNLKKSDGVPSDRDYQAQRKVFEKSISKVLSRKGHNAYTQPYANDSPTCFVNSNILYMPFYKGKKIRAVLKIDEKGSKFYMKHSEPKGAVHVVKPPVDNESFIYLCEGLRTGYAVRRGLTIEGAGVLCVGSCGNMENIIKFLKEDKKYENIVICTEKSAHEYYLSLKVKYDCLLVGSETHSDMHSYFNSMGIEMLKKNLVSFRQKTYIPIGVDFNGKMFVYIKQIKNIGSYQRTTAKELYMDAHNTKELPNLDVQMKFFWEVRNLCRKSGTINTIKKIKEGLLPYKGKLFYYDTENLYLIKNKKVRKIDAQAVICNELVLCKDKNKELIDMEKVEPLEHSEIRKLFKILNIFNISEFEKKLIVGWVIQSILCGGLSYRCPIWVNAPTGTGKTQLTNRILTYFFIFYERKVGRQTTPKWIHRCFHGRAIPLIRDEYDPSKKHAFDTMDEMECVRSVATERFPERGISAGIDDTTQTFSFCFSALYSSIRKPKEVSEADLARFVSVKMNRGLNDFYNEKILAFQKKMDITMKTRLYKSLFFLIPEIEKEYNKLMSDPNIRFSGHEKSSFLMLMCCYNSIMNDKIQMSEILPKIKRENPEGFSRVLIQCLDLSLTRQHYGLTESKSLYTLLCAKLLNKKEVNDDSMVLEGKGIFVLKDSLYINEKKGVKFLSKLFRENNTPFTGEKILCSELENDGMLFVKKCKKSEKTQTKQIPRGVYLMFDWKKIKKEME